MMTVVIYGHSDDLITVHGDVSTELKANLNEPTTVWVGGSFITFEYDYRWNVTDVSPGKHDSYVVLREDSSPHSYSDVVALNTGNFKEPEVYD